MGLFSSDKSRIAELFATDGLDELVWREQVDTIADGHDFVDVVVSSPKPAFLAATYKLGLTYWPDGPVVRGVQNYAQGSSVTFARVPVKKGATLALAASTDWGNSLPARVDVVPSGSGASVERDRQGAAPKSPVEQFFEGAGVLVGFAVVLGVLYVVAKVES